MDSIPITRVLEMVEGLSKDVLANRKASEEKKDTAIGKALEALVEGDEQTRKEVAALLTHEHPWVRFFAARAMLPFETEAARATLEELVSSQVGSRVAVRTVTLIGFWDRQRLNKLY